LTRVEKLSYFTRFFVGISRFERVEMVLV
jgi:hypothetical protein